MKKKVFETDMPVVVCSERKWYVVDINRLLFVESQNQYCRLYFKNRKKPIKIRVSLTRIYALLPKTSFAKVNYSFIVNVWSVVSFNSTEVEVLHCGKTREITITDHNFYLHFYDIFEER